MRLKFVRAYLGFKRGDVVSPQIDEEGKFKLYCEFEGSNVTVTVDSTKLPEYLKADKTPLEEYEELSNAKKVIFLETVFANSLNQAVQENLEGFVFAEKQIV